MSNTISKSRLITYVALFLMFSQSAVAAGRIKGTRRAQAPTQRRRLKKKKIKGPSSRSCTECKSYKPSFLITESLFNTEYQRLTL